MRYPNLRYGNPNELRHYAQGIPTKELAQQLRRSERSVNDWLKEQKKVPWWIPELLRLRHAEHEQQLRRMGIKRLTEKKRRADHAANDSLFRNQNGQSGINGPRRGAVANQTTPRPLLHQV